MLPIITAVGGQWPCPSFEAPNRGQFELWMRDVVVLYAAVYVVLVVGMDRSGGCYCMREGGGEEEW